MSRVLRWFVVLALLVSLGLFICVRATILIRAATAAAKQAQWPVAVTISKETTYITEPLRADGYIDYVAALNQRCSLGVTQENNAAVLFWQAVGPGPCEAGTRDLFFKMLGIPTPPEKGDYFIPFEQYFKQSRQAKSGSGISREKQNLDEKPSEPELPMGVALSTEEVMKLLGGAKSAEEEELDNQMHAATTRPWSAKEFPKFADWLAVNEKPLALVLEGTRRSRYYDPLVAPQKEEYQLMSVDLSAMQTLRSFARALGARAMLRLAEGKIDAAWQDLLACHRLARLEGQGPMYLEALVSYAINGMACVGERALLQHADLSSAQIGRMQDDLNKLPPAPKIADKIDEAERFAMLDSILTIARNPAVKEGAVTEEEEFMKPLKAILLSGHRGKPRIDWDLVLRTESPWYDRMADACRQPTRAKRIAAFDRLDDDLHKKLADLKDKKWLVLDTLTDPSRALSERFAYANLTLLLPAGSPAFSGESNDTMDFDLTRLAFALAAYRADNGSYPMRLAQLAPKYIATVPEDVFAAVSARDLLPDVAKSVADLPERVFRGTALHYEAKDGGYVLYSVGRGGADDGGRTFDEFNEADEDKYSWDWDDLVVRMPAAPQHAKP